MSLQKHHLSLVVCLLLLLCLTACQNQSPPVKIGISMGVGDAMRWPKELQYMEEKATELGIIFETRLNKTDTPKTQTQDCKEMIDSGIAVLVLVPRDVRKSEEIIAYAVKNNVKVISYARPVMGESVDLFVGYDTYRIGQDLGRHMAEKVIKGDIIFLKGDENDTNAQLMHYGSLKYLQPLIQTGDLRVVLDTYVPNWSLEEAKILLREALVKNNRKIDAIFAHNDLLAGVCNEVLKELNIREPAIIVGMDAELAALRRIVNDEQDATVHLDIKVMAQIAITEAYHIAIHEKVNANSSFDNNSSHKIDAYLINGKVVTKENLDRVVIKTGHVSHEDVYGVR